MNRPWVRPLRKDPGPGVCYVIFVKCSWVATRWQQYSTHLHTDSTQKDTKQIIHKTLVLVISEINAQNLVL